MTQKPEINALSGGNGAVWSKLAAAFASPVVASQDCPVGAAAANYSPDFFK